MSGSPAQDHGCPKHMVMGPCGGVQADGGCEVGPHPCVFPQLRPFRLAQKQRAGAAVAVLNHDTIASVTGFMAAAAQAGVTIPVIAAVAIFTDAASAAALSGLPGLELDPDVVRTVLDDADPVAAGIAAAARQARALLDIPGVAGVNISGLASARGHEFAAQINAELAARIREGSAA